MKKYYLVTDATAEEVTAKTGVDAHQTHLGALVERPPEFDIHGAMAELDRAFNPNRCTCGAYAVIHRPGCPAGLIKT